VRAAGRVWGAKAFGIGTFKGSLGGPVLHLVVHVVCFVALGWFVVRGVWGGRRGDGSWNGRERVKGEAKKIS
jgi:diadenosine tetraphosphate (Ap4A) HIT family hydrolase